MGCGTIAALALTAAGAGTQMVAANKAKSAMNDRTQEELNRQSQYQKKASMVFQQGLDKSGTPAADQQIEQGRMQTLAASQMAKLPSLAMPSLTNNMGQMTNPQSSVAYVGQDAKNQLGVEANAGLRGYGNYGFQQGLKNQDMNNQLSVINNNASRSQNVLPYELQQAQHSQDSLNAIGSLMGTAGSLAGLYGITAAPKAGMSAAQMGAMGAGLGPVSSSFASTLPAATVATGQSMFNPMLSSSYWMSKPLGLYGF